MSLLKKLADAAVQKKHEIQEPRIKRNDDDTAGDKANIKALNKNDGGLDLGAGSDVFHFGSKEDVTGTVDMGDAAGENDGDRFGADRDILKLSKDLSAYEITETDGGFIVEDRDTGSKITFSGVDIIKTNSETFNLNKVTIEDVIAQSEIGVDWSGNNHAGLDDLGGDDVTLKMGAGRDKFLFNDLNRAASGTVDLGHADGKKDSVILQGSMDDYTIKSAGVNTFQVTSANGSTVDIIGMEAEDQFVFRNVEKSAGERVNYENDLFTAAEMAEAAALMTYQMPYTPPHLINNLHKTVSENLDIEMDWTIA